MVEYKQPRDLETAAGFLGISVTGVKRLISEGKLTAFKVGPKQCVRIPQAELERHVNENIIDPFSDNFAVQTSQKV